MDGWIMRKKKGEKNKRISLFRSCDGQNEEQQHVVGHDVKRK
jgi:hypothetical protein